MRLPGGKRIKHLARWLRARALGGALILGYHRISPGSNTFHNICVSPENFAEHMEVLRKYARPISLPELTQHLRWDTLPAKSVAVTFDDGYVDNLLVAKPILEKYEIPATFFVCSGYQGREFWWDELDRLVTLSEAGPGGLRLEVNEKSFAWDQTGVGPEADMARFRHALYHFLLELDIEEQSQAMDAVRSWSGIASGNPSPARSMSPAELLRLGSGDLIEIGAHTRFHPILPRLAVKRQREEIVAGKLELEEILGRTVDGFAYPNGMATMETKRIVREAGFAYACTSLHDVVRPTSDPHWLTRFWQKNVDGEQFMKNLKLWM